MLGFSREFIELAIFDNITLVAKRLHLSPSTLSRHLSELEQELGFKLFDRNPLRLTAAGKYYLENISTLINNLDAIIAQGRMIAEEKLETFTIYMIDSHSTWGDIVYEAISSMRKLHPNIDFIVRTNDRKLTTEEALVSGAADAAIVFEGPLVPSPELALYPLLEGPLCAWVTSSNKLAEKESIGLSELDGLAIPVSTNRQSQVGTQALLDLLRAHEVAVTPRLRNINERIGFYLLREDEVMLDSAEDDEPFRFNPELVKLRLDPPVSLQVYLATRATGVRSITRDFVTACRCVADSLH